MKSKWIIVLVFSALCIFVACSKNSSSDDSTPPLPPGPVVDSSKCKLSEVTNPMDITMPYFRSNFFLLYDSLKRITFRGAGGELNVYTYEPGKITQRIYYNSVADSNLGYRIIYTLGINDRVVSHTQFAYFRPKSESDYISYNRMDYEYNGEGYLTGLKLYTSGTTLSKESKFTYQDGNLAQRENTYYNFTTPVTKAGGDTLTYTYDNTPWIPEAAYLFEVGEYGDVRAGKPNKNNVTGIQCKIYEGNNPNRNSFKSIQYSYSLKGPKLERVNMIATTTKGATINNGFGFKYVCN